MGSFVTDSNANPPAPMNNVKIFKGWPLQDAPSKLVQLEQVQTISTGQISAWWK